MRASARVHTRGCSNKIGAECTDLPLYGLDPGGGQKIHPWVLQETLEACLGLIRAVGQDLTEPAAIRWKLPVEKGEVPAVGGRLVDQKDPAARIRQIESCCEAGKSRPNDQDIGVVFIV
jgi:hypothetical protein